MLPQDHFKVRNFCPKTFLWCLGDPVILFVSPKPPSLETVLCGLDQIRPTYYVDYHFTLPHRNKMEGKVAPRTFHSRDESIKRQKPHKNHTAINEHVKAMREYVKKKHGQNAEHNMLIYSSGCTRLGSPQILP